MKYLLLNPVVPATFSISYSNSDTPWEELRERLKESGFELLESNSGLFVHRYITSDTKGLLEELCTEFDLEGIVVEYNVVYDNILQEEA